MTTGASTCKRLIAALAGVAAVLLGLAGCVHVAFGGIHAYMVSFGRATPGEPIFLDELASPLEESLLQVAIGIALLVAAFLLNRLMKRFAAER